jgi:hypothetical protein
MKTVFNNDMVCHVWAQQTQDNGRNAKSSIFFEGDTIYSYGKHFWIGYFAERDAVLLNSSKYSVTTSSHQWAVESAVDHLKTFTVPYRDNHAGNMRHYIDMIESAMNTASRSKRSSYLNSYDSAMFHIKRAGDHFQELLSYSKTFNVYTEYQFPTQQSETILTKKKANDAKWDNPKEVAKREKAKLAKERAERKKNINDIRDRVFRFRNGNNFVGYGMSFPVLLRLDNETVKTSQNAEMPVKFAKAIWQMVAKCKSSKTVFKPNGKTIHAGHFQVSKIDDHGNLTAGCHYIKYGVIKNMARQLNLI